MLQIDPIPAFTDNYIWLLTRPGQDDCAVVDPGESGPVIDALEQRGLRLAHILLTHHHHDHVGGVPALRECYRPRITGPNDRRIPGDFEVVGDGDRAPVPSLDIEFDVIGVPGHTRSHIAFHDDQRLFIGDTLFSVGCGRLFEGTPEQMQQSLDRLDELGDEVFVYCAHEYTAANCRFARQVEPDNAALAERSTEVSRLRDEDRVTVPTRLGDERRMNPFLRTRQPAVVEAARRHTGDDRIAPGAATMSVIRAWKDAF